jgi:nucleoside-diphosphate-sugar epimerase
MSFLTTAIGKESKILVTGGTGFLGAYIIRELIEQGFTVRAIRRFSKLPFFIPADTFDSVEWVEADILDIPAMEQAMQSIDVIIHAAAKISFNKKEKDDMFRTNIDGTINIVNIALEQGIKKLVYISSVAALGRTTNGATVNEGAPWNEVNPQSNYASSKYHAEMEVWRAIGEGLNAVIVNPSTIIGYGDWNASSCAIFKNVFNEFPWYTNGITGFVDVKDIAKSVVMLMQMDIQGERFLLSGENCSFRDFFDQVADGFSKKHPHWEATPFMGAVAWRLEQLRSFFTGKRSVLTRETARIAQSVTYFENAKILKYLPGFQFTPLHQTIREACLAYQNHQPG